MDGIVKPALDATTAFPYIQVSLGILVVLAGIYIMTRGQRDTGTKPETTPQWINAGPLHDMMGAVHDVAEESRRANDLLRDIRGVMNEAVRELQNARQTLEMIRNESRMR
ncbi:MAG: hypothetical protein WBH00_23200 [Xanthobacteraceae bacterium]